MGKIVEQTGALNGNQSRGKKTLHSNLVNDSSKIDLVSHPSMR